MRGCGLPLAAAALALCASGTAPLGKGPATADQEAAQGRPHSCEGYDEEWSECPDMAPCGTCKPADCEFHEWGDWYDGGGCIGLKFRDRTIKAYNNECGKPCSGPKKMSVPTPLDDQCGRAGTACVFSAWSEWSNCSSDDDQSIRSRAVEKPPSQGGQQCSGAVRETKACGPDPKRVDCSFTTWDDWTTCSVSCGTGRMSRFRSVGTKAAHGGSTCSDALLQVAGCSAKECPNRDCKVSGWSEWSMCDEDHPQRYRHRTVLEAPEGDGNPCSDKLAETRGCPTGGPVDCQLGEWTSWSDCTKSCAGGQRYRERQLETPSARGGNCSEAVLKETSSCNVGPCSVGDSPGDCKLSEWEAWSTCSAECGEGSRQRERKVTALAAHGGEGCDAALEEVAPCSRQGCNATDCKWSDWDEWSGCSCTCGGGTKRRNRAISQSPSLGGQLCEPLDKGEVSPCNTQPCEKGCTDGQWGEWMPWSGCSATCSSGFRSRRRDVEVQPNHCGKPASGLREEFEVCSDLPSCVEDKDCELSVWGPWSDCSLECFGVRERNRYISVFASGAGKPCAGDALKVVEPCNPAADDKEPPESCADESPQDCELGDWLPWSRCSAKCGGGQTERRRNINAPPSNGGKPCQDDLLVTAACNTQPCDQPECQDCEWALWSDWTDCTGGQRFRHRTIQRLPNSCGKPCEAESSKETQNCTSSRESVGYCVWTAWSDASNCGEGCGSATTMRNRAMTLKKSEPRDGEFIFKVLAPDSVKCLGTQLNISVCPNTKSCGAPCEPVNCKFGDWSSWSEPACTGLCDRHRVVARTNNECGSACDGPLVESKRCHTSCNERKDCALGSWGDWTECNEVAGQKYRTREVTQQPQNGGKACAGAVHETAGCSQSNPQDCELTSWQEWGSCSQSCGVGWRERSRGVLNAAENGGEQCGGSLKELGVCESNGTACAGAQKVDCQLEDWTSWSSCGHSGQQERFRKVLRTAANGGAFCEGPLHETATCEQPAVDCSISDWTAWEQCDRTCGGGQTHRVRQIHEFAQNGGVPCPPELIETMGCGEEPCSKQDCEVSDWTKWGECSTSCGPGVRMRNRTILRTRAQGGDGCLTHLGEAEACQDSSACGPVDCAWADWSDWDACSDDCGGGQHMRVRLLSSPPQNGGLPCNASDKEQVGPCNTQPCSAECVDGKFGDWEAWGSCTASCDGGTATRHRKVVRTANECGKVPEGKASEVKFCNTDVECQPSVDCEFSSWGGWSDCSTDCNGVMHRARRVKKHGRGNGAWCVGALKEIWPCNPGPNETAPEHCVAGSSVDCELGLWGSWGECSASCGGGQMSRTREVATQPRNGGKGCNGSLSEVGQCANVSCGGPPVQDCEHADWSDWGACASCSGQRIRYRKISKYPQNGGLACEQTDLEEVGECPVDCHGNVTYCTFMKWEDWGTCSQTCGAGGKRYRRRYLHLSASTGGMPAPTDTFQEKYDSLYVRTKALEDDHLRELVAAFIGGCCSLTAMLVGVRVLLPRASDAEDALPESSSRSLPRGPQDAGGRLYHRLQANSDTSLPLVGSSSPQHGEARVPFEMD